MVRLTKIYTKTGDEGMTSLAGNVRIKKISQRIIAIGDVDELNASLGFVAAAMHKIKECVELQAKILRIQNELFDLGAQLAVLPEKRRSDTPMIHAETIVTLENEIDVMNADLPTLHSFILPGGSEITARLHLARVICRRTERSIILLNESEKLDEIIIPYLNRLSDWLFVAARFANAKLNEKEILWQQSHR